MDIATVKKTGMDLQLLNGRLQDLIERDADIKNAILQNPDYVDRLLQTIIIDEIKADLQKQKNALSYNWTEETARFLDAAALNSVNTKKAYSYALKDFQTYTKEIGLKSPFLSDAETADNWIHSQRLQGKASATIRRNCGAVSSFFSYMERRPKSEIKNIFRGTKARPKKANKKKIENEIPTTNLNLFKKDIMTIINAEQDKELKAIIYIMAFRGLRAGSFERMNIHGGRFFTTSKGKEINGALPDICLQALDDLQIKHNEPFAKWTGPKVSSAFQYHISKLYQSGAISYKYSAHDLRHYFALSEYTRTKDIYNVSKLLGHSSIAITEIYLRGLKVIE